jgi:hypothetical protein
MSSASLTISPNFHLQLQYKTLSELFIRDWMEPMIECCKISILKVVSSLKWLAFSLRPLRLEGLAEVFILDYEKDVPFDEGERLFKPTDVFKHLSDLVSTNA